MKKNAKTAAASQRLGASRKRRTSRTAESEAAKADKALRRGFLAALKTLKVFSDAPEEEVRLSALRQTVDFFMSMEGVKQLARIELRLTALEEAVRGGASGNKS